jgi:methyltransferase (TIGR00027 family)
MRAGEPSITALAAAGHRAAHQVLEQGRIFRDPLALRILGEDGARAVESAEARPSSRRMRIFIAARTRFAEDSLAAAVQRGVTQLVVLGAGLDTYAYRSPWGERLRIFEVDHPATQAWKRERLGEASIAIPEWLTFVPVDFERETLAQGFAKTGFDARQPAFFTWLGVAPYLTVEAVWSTLRYIASLASGAQVVFDYANPPESLDEEARAWHLERAARVAGIGEAWVTYFETAELREKLLALGFGEIDDLGPRRIAERYFPDRAAAMPEKGGHMVRAATL